VTDKANSYYFDVNWEVCARSGERFLFFRDRLRSAVRIIDRHYYLAGPDLKSRPEFSEPGECWRKLIHDRAGLNREEGWEIPGEPRAVFANFGRKMNTKFHLYELWEDSGLVIKESGWSCLEPVMYNHSCRTFLDLIYGPALDQWTEKPDLFFGTGRLCVKRKNPEPETVLNSVASFKGRLNYSGHVNIYFETNRPGESSAVIRAGAHSGEFAMIAAASGISPLSLGPFFVNNSAVFLSAAEGESTGRPADETSAKFFTSIRQDEGNSLSSFLWIMGT